MIIRFYTQNSVYDVDYELNRYRRMPNDETAFQAPELRNPQGSYRLVDGPWIELCPERQAYLDHSKYPDDDFMSLRIFTPESEGGVYTSQVLALKALP